MAGRNRPADEVVRVVWPSYFRHGISYDYTCKQLGRKIHARKVLLHVRLDVAHSLIPLS
jgi:hypothetical protein